MATALERLEELLDLKDEALDAANQRINELEAQMRFGADWMLHGRESPDESDLPVPRLELTLLENEDYHSEQQVVLVIAERHGKVARVPLAYSKTTGGGVPLEHCATKGELNIHLLPGLINDGCFYSDKTGLPLYVVLDEEHRYKVEALRPLRVIAL